MSLRWEFTDKEAYAKLTDEDKALNDCFVWGSLFLDIRDITADNANEWVWRWTFGTKLNGAYYRNADGTPFIPTLEDVLKRVGLSTNVPTKTRKQFIAKVVKHYEADHK